MKKILFSICFLTTFCGAAQHELNNYKYIVVPKNLEGFRQANQYQTSTLIKYLFTQKGFTTVYDDALPQDLNEDRCLGLYAQLLRESSLFATKVKIALKDCYGEDFYITREGLSKEKEYKKAYSESIREAFTSFNGYDYKYTPKAASNTTVVKNSTDAVAEQPREEKKPVAVVKEAPKEAVVEETPVAVATSSAPEVTVSSVPDKAVNPRSEVAKKEVWYAQEIPNGYQLVDSTPKIQLKMYSSSISGVYHAQYKTRNGIVHKKEGVWIFEYYEAGVLKTESLAIKF